MLYDAKYAQEQYEKILTESRRGISLTEQELIRYVIPKNQAKERYTKEEIREMMNHINSYPRKKWNGQAPIDLFVKIYGQEAAERLGLEKIPSDSIHLTPALFKK